VVKTFSRAFPKIWLQPSETFSSNTSSNIHFLGIDWIERALKIQLDGETTGNSNG